MDTLENIVANNITELRKSQKWTQAELAEKLNYSDKSVSKWERGDALPDLKVLKSMADLFGVTLDGLVNENAAAERKKYSAPAEQRGYKIGVAMLGVMLIWLIVTLVYVYFAINYDKNLWTAFIWGVPASAILLAYYDARWYDKKFAILLHSIFCWSLLAAVYLQLLRYNMWMLFIVGVPTQAIIILWHFIRRKR